MKSHTIVISQRSLLFFRLVLLMTCAPSLSVVLPLIRHFSCLHSPHAPPLLSHLWLPICQRMRYLFKLQQTIISTLLCSIYASASLLLSLSHTYLRLLLLLTILPCLSAEYASRIVQLFKPRHTLSQHSLLLFTHPVSHIQSSYTMKSSQMR